MASTSGENDRSFDLSFEEKLRLALKLDLPYSERYTTATAAQAAVLALFAFPIERGGAPALLVIKRTHNEPDAHSGQMAFPGGKCEPSEIASGDLSKTALREAHEEVGILPSDVSIEGQLPKLVTGTGFEVTPFVGILLGDLDDVKLKLDPREVAEAYWIPWTKLEDPATYQREMFQRGAVRFPTHVFTVEGNRIWGATGAMIRNLLDRLSQVG